VELRELYKSQELSVVKFHKNIRRYNLAIGFALGAHIWDGFLRFR
jgi:hypothetical protein